MASTLVKWKPGANGFYESHTMQKKDWKGLGFTDDADTAPVVFNRENNFTVVGDDLSFAQMDFFESNPDFQVKKDPAAQESASKSGEGEASGSSEGESASDSKPAGRRTSKQ